MFHVDTSTLDGILEAYKEILGAEYQAYRNHCCRVLHYALLLAGTRPSAHEKLSIAIAFHDLGLWTEGKLDYLPPSEALCCTYLEENGLENWTTELVAMIRYHHKLRAYRQNPGWLVEVMRQADLIDLSAGWVRFGVSKRTIREMSSAFPYCQFHSVLMGYTKTHFKTRPFSNPMAMYKL